VGGTARPNPPPKRPPTIGCGRFRRCRRTRSCPPSSSSGSGPASSRHHLGPARHRRGWRRGSSASGASPGRSTTSSPTGMHFDGSIGPSTTPSRSEQTGSVRAGRRSPRRRVPGFHLGRVRGPPPLRPAPSDRAGTARGRPSRHLDARRLDPWRCRSTRLTGALAVADPVSGARSPSVRRPAARATAPSRRCPRRVRGRGGRMRRANRSRPTGRAGPPRGWSPR